MQSAAQVLTNSDLRLTPLLLVLLLVLLVLLLLLLTCHRSELVAANGLLEGDAWNNLKSVSGTLAAISTSLWSAVQQQQRDDTIGGSCCRAAAQPRAASVCCYFKQA
jgi:hypothetical protein